MSTAANGPAGHHRQPKFVSRSTRPPVPQRLLDLLTVAAVGVAAGCQRVTRVDCDSPGRSSYVQESEKRWCEVRLRSGREAIKVLRPSLASLPTRKACRQNPPRRCL